jgi:hypothetical protein
LKNEYIHHFNDEHEHVNDIYQDAVANFYRLDAMEYKSEYERAMALKPYLDLINSFKSAYNEGWRQSFRKFIQERIENGEVFDKQDAAKKMLKHNFEVDEIMKLTGLSKNEVWELKLLD